MSGNGSRELLMTRDENLGHGRRNRHSDGRNIVIDAVADFVGSATEVAVIDT